LLIVAALSLVACAGDARRPPGETCSRDGECVSALCAESVCLDPELDEDGDGRHDDVGS